MIFGLQENDGDSFSQAKEFEVIAIKKLSTELDVHELQIVFAWVDMVKNRVPLS